VHLLWAKMMRVCRSAARSLHPIGNRFSVRPIVMRIRAARGCSQQYRSDSSDHLSSLFGFLSRAMPNPWEPSSFQLKSTLSFAAASLMPPARLSDVMLLPPRSNWQARLHDKFEEFAQGFDQDDERWGWCGKGGGGAVKHSKTAPCSRRSGQGGAAKLSNRAGGNFLRNSRPSMNTGAGWMKNSPVRGMFPDVG